MALLSKQDEQRIERAIAGLEQKSAAEFVVAVLPRSAGYSGIRVVAAALWGLAGATAYLEFSISTPTILAVAVQVPVACLAWFFLGWPPLLRKLIPRRVAERAVEARAFQLFAARGVHQTRDRTGMLLLLSELERRVVLLGDRGIHERVGNDGWQKNVEHIVRGIHEHRAADAILEVLRELEAALALGVPLRAGDTNELPDELVRSE